MPIFDAFGTWESVGTITEVTRDFQLFPFFSNTPNSTFRIAYTCNRPQYFPSLRHIFLRAVYFSGSSYFADTRWKKLWAKDTPEVFQYPYPQDMIKTPLPKRQFEIKFGRIPNRLIPDTDVFLSVELFEKVSSNVSYPLGETADNEEDPIIILP
jgi:hypothetical protein